MSGPRVTVVIPCFNQARFLADAIGSVLAQTLSCDEIFLVDDGSDDDVRRALQPFGDRARLIQQERGGPAAARNAGIALATGDYIAFLDADDRWAPTKIERQLAFLEANPQVGMVFTAVRLFGEGDGVGCLRGMWNGPVSLADMVQRTPIWTPSTVLMRAAVSRDVGELDVSTPPSEDWDLYIRVAEKYEVVGIPEPLVEYRLHSTNSSKAMRRMFDGRMTVLDKHEASHRADPSLAAAFAVARRGAHKSYAAGLCAEVKEHWRNGRFFAAAKALAGIAYHDSSFLLSGLRRVSRSSSADVNGLRN